jgi:Flp pilus assembly protein TadD
MTIDTLISARPTGHEVARRQGDDEGGALVATARVLFEQGARAYREARFHVAVELLREATRAEPTSSLLRYQLGLVLARLGRHREALPEVYRAHVLAPKKFAVVKDLALLLEYVGQRECARDAWSWALPLAPDGETRGLIVDRLAICAQAASRPPDDSAAPAVA